MKVSLMSRNFPVLEAETRGLPAQKVHKFQIKEEQKQLIPLMRLIMIKKILKIFKQVLLEIHVMI